MMVALSPRLVAERFRLVVAGCRKDNLDYTVRFSYAYPVSVWGTLNGQGRVALAGLRQLANSRSHDWSGMFRSEGVLYVTPSFLFATS